MGLWLKILPIILLLNLFHHIIVGLLLNYLWRFLGHLLAGAVTSSCGLLLVLLTLLLLGLNKFSVIGFLVMLSTGGGMRVVMREWILAGLNLYSNLGVLRTLNKKACIFGRNL